MPDPESWIPNPRDLSAQNLFVDLEKAKQRIMNEKPRGQQPRIVSMRQYDALLTHRWDEAETQCHDCYMWIEEVIFSLKVCERRRP